MDGQTLAAAIAISRGSGGGSFAPDINDPQDGDTLVYDGTEEKWVNGSGGGSGGGYLKLTKNAETGALDKTWKEIYDAFSAGYYVSLIVNSEEDEECYTRTVYYIGWGSGAYWIQLFNPQEPSSDPMVFNTNSENGYPVLQD